MGFPEYINILLTVFGILSSVIMFWANKDKPWQYRLLNALLVGIVIATIGISIVALWPGIEGLSSPMESTESQLVPTEMSANSEQNNEGDVLATELPSDFATDEGTNLGQGNENIAEAEYSPITYNNGLSCHVLSATIVHYPNLERKDFTVGGVWSLDPDFTEADPYELVYSNYSVIVRRNSDNIMIGTGKVQFGTVWSEDNQGNWSESAETFNSPFTNRQMSQESYGTFAVTLVPSNDNLLPGEYTCEIHIQLNGSEYTMEVSFTIN